MLTEASQALHSISTKSPTELPTSCVAFLRSEPTLRPTTSNQNCAAVSSFASIQTNQSDSNQHVKPTNQDSTIWTNQTVQIWISDLHKNGPIRNEGGNFLYKRWPPLCLLSFHLRLCFPGLLTVPLNKVSPPSLPRIGASC
ncbi:hypothetical protein mRhiFer1_009452 [Rhinolophus ferrumequinum]|uniref:Uncharacterized protein n=1 Tax=Rhinolophus ferrumequinum TaxID=59479 RepID=A0A7J7RIR6_RHIFE|nr:hypothetical protein mRhiFer1_009452 [Rhinolophus ferrumequinum]